MHPLCIFYCEFEQPLSVKESDPLHSHLSQHICCLSTMTKTTVYLWAMGYLQSASAVYFLVSLLQEIRERWSFSPPFSPSKSYLWVVSSAIINSAVISALTYRGVFFLLQTQRPGCNNFWMWNVLIYPWYFHGIFFFNL